MKLLCQAWEEVASVQTKPACSWAGRGLTPGSWASALAPPSGIGGGWGGLLTAPLACRLVSETPELQGMHGDIVTLNVP